MGNDKTWHKLNKVREDILKSEISMSEFAADLYAVKMGNALEVYQNPESFFNRTFPTSNMKRLVKDVLLRLSGESGKPILTLQVTYGGGKTHTLITLFHLAENGHKFPDNQTVKSFYNYSGINSIPQTRVAILPFDKFDYHKGLTVISPDGNKTTCKTPWGAFAYQLGGEKGLEYIREHEEKYTPPAQPVIEELIEMSFRENKSVLLLVDEAVIYCRTAVNNDANKLGTLKDFFQALTQAVAAKPKAAMVSTLIASQVEAVDSTGIKVLESLEQIFQRFAESQEPVSKDDVPEILRRRLFEKTEDRNSDEVTNIVDSLVGTYDKFDELRKDQKGNTSYNKLKDNYPFHPELLNIFQAKWTDLNKFQKTRGLLRILASAMSFASKYDDSSFLSAKSLLSNDNQLSSGIMNMLEILDEENWRNILISELDKAKECQINYPGLKNREIEQAVISTFLHSQPKGKSANIADLFSMILVPQIDITSFKQGLEKWKEISWYLKEDMKVWQLTTTPNLTNMHAKAMEGIDSNRINRELSDLVNKVKAISECPRDVKLHKMPNSPKDVPDDGVMKYIIFEPNLACSSNFIPEEIKEFFFSKSGESSSRVYKNALIGLATDNNKLTRLQIMIKKILGWKSIESSDDIKTLEEIQKKELQKRKRKDEEEIIGMIQSTYCMYLSINENGDLEAKTLEETGKSSTHFEKITKALYDEGRFLDETIDYTELLPNTEYNIWGKDETSKRVNDLVKMFAQFSRLPKLLNPRVIYNALKQGIEEGSFIAQIERPDKSEKIYWKVALTLEEFEKNRDIKVAPIDRAVVHTISSEALYKIFKELKTPSRDIVTVEEIKTYFSREDSPKLDNEEIIYGGIAELILDGRIMGKLKDVTFLQEKISDSLKIRELSLLEPTQINTFNFEDVFSSKTKMNLKEFQEIASKITTGYQLPWIIIKKLVNEGLTNKYIEILNSEIWPCNKEDAANVEIKKHEVVEGEPKEKPTITIDPFIQPQTSQSKTLKASSEFKDFELQDIVEALPKLKEIAPNLEFKFNLSIHCVCSDEDLINKLNELLKNYNKNFQFYR